MNRGRNGLEWNGMRKEMLLIRASGKSVSIHTWDFFSFICERVIQ